MVWSWLWGISWLGWVVFWVLSNTFVFDVGNISTISISYVVGDNLGTTIGKVDTVFTVGGISVTGFVGLEVGVSIIIMDSISVLVYSWSFFIDWSLAISWSWGVVSWGMYNWLVYNWYNWGDVWSWLVYYWGDIWSWSMNWGWVVYWSWLVNWGWVVYWSWFVYWGWVVWGWLVYWDMSWGMYSSAVFFSSVWVVYVLWGGMGLARDSSVVSSMGLVYSYFDSWGIAVLYDLVTALVSQSNSQKSRDSDESLWIE